MHRVDSTLESIEDYSGKESSEIRLTPWIVVLSGLLISAIHGIIASGTSVSGVTAGKEKTGIIKY